MAVKLIVAVDQGNAIGWRDGRLPWKLPADMARFKKLTTGSTVLMGRTTFESLGREHGLPNRENIVISSSKNFDREHVRTLKSMPGLIREQESDLWVIGGASVYAQALETKAVDELYVTLVDVTSGADVSLPFELYNWQTFITEQKKFGVYWQPTTVNNVRQTDHINITFLQLSRVK